MSKNGLTEVFSAIQGMENDIIEWRRHLHQNPELSHHEHQTADYIESCLRGFGIESVRRRAGTGVVADIVGGDGPWVGLRADIDALPITEETGLPFCSRNPGVMHACGHDAHTAMLLGAARYLQGLAAEGRLAGSVRLLFQPAEECQDEEGRSGGLKLVEEGEMEGLHRIFGQHISPGMSVGTISVLPGPLTAASDYFELEVCGAQAHGAAPHSGTDAIAIAAVVVGALQQIVSRKINPMDSRVISIGTIHGGTAPNVVADSVKMRGTMRSHRPEVRAKLEQELRSMVGIADAMGGSAKLTIRKGYPMVVNDPEVSASARAAVIEAMGAEVFAEYPVVAMGSEDFGYMVERVPGCFMRVGVRSPEWESPRQLHTPTADIDERCLVYGATNLAAQVLNVCR